MGARRQGMVYTHRSCENAHLPKIDPWITQRTLTGSVAAVVIEVWGCQPEVDVEGLLHEIIKLTRLAHRRRYMLRTHSSCDNAVRTCKTIDPGSHIDTHTHHKVHSGMQKEGSAELSCV